MDAGLRFPYTFLYYKITFTSKSGQREKRVARADDWNSVVLKKEAQDSTRTVADVRLCVEQDVGTNPNATVAKMNTNGTLSLLFKISVVQSDVYYEGAPNNALTDIAVKMICWDKMFWCDTHLNPYVPAYLQYKLKKAKKVGQKLDETLVEDIWRNQVCSYCEKKKHAHEPTTVWLSESLVFVTSGTRFSALNNPFFARWPALQKLKSIDACFGASYLIPYEGQGNCYVRQLRLDETLADTLFGKDIDARVAYALGTQTTKESSLY